MKKILLLIGVAALALPACKNEKIQAPEGYTLVWHDEFDEGPELGPDWTYEVKDDHWVNRELQNYREREADGKRVAEVRDGELQIHCFKGSDDKIYSARVYAKKDVG